MKIYLEYVKPYVLFFIMAPLLMILEVYCEVKIPSLSAEIINMSVAGGDISAIAVVGLQMLMFTVIAVSGGVGASYFATKASVNFCHDLREDVFVKIQNFSFNNIDKFSTGSLITRLTNDITQIGLIVVMCLRMLFRAPGMLIGAMIMSYTISPAMATIFLVLTPVLALVVYVVLKISYPRFAALQDKIDALNVAVQENLMNIRVIKAFTREGFERDKFKTVNENLKNTGLSAYRVSILQMPLMTFFVNMATVALLWFGSQLLGTGELLIGDISAFITYLAQILMSVNMIAMIFLQSSRSLVSGKRVLKVLQEDIDIEDLEAKFPEKQVMSGDVVFKNVNFKYYKNSLDKVLTDINVEIKSGQSVGIVGSTGCGKTTFVHLISRLYDVDSGEILVDGVNVKDYSLENLRDGVAVVLQNNLLFSGTVRENLLWGNKNASDADLARVCEYAAARDFVENMPEKYDTYLHQGGLNLSGGQKQRLCIARALAKNTKILILDDSTSAVDTATERKINKHLNEDLKDMTKIIIAQRISSVVDCDMILVMDEGEISALGTHDELLEKSLVYQEIYCSQMDNGSCENLVAENATLESEV